MPQSYFHLSGIVLRPGSIIEPGNFGRIVNAMGAQHEHWMREQALEAARVKNHAAKPSRLDAAFVSIDEAEARSFRARIPGFTHHVLYSVSLLDPSSPSHLTDTRLCAPQGNGQYNWADLYWRDYDPEALIIPGLGSLAAATKGVACREVLTLSPLRIEAVL